MDAMELSAIQSERYLMAANSDVQADYPMELQDGDARKPPLSHKEPPEEQVKMLPNRRHTDALVEIVRMPSWSEQESRRSLQYTANQLRRRGAGDKTEESQEIIQRTDAGIGAIENIRNMAAPMEEKKRIHKEMKNSPTKHGQTRHTMSNNVQHFKDFLVNVRDSFVVLGQWSWFLWSGHLLTIEGHFGSSVASYFHFIRALVFLNVPVFLVILAFVVIPQILYRWLQQSPLGYHQNVSFTGEELLTGQGWFLETELYYGYYTNQVINITGVPYDMKYAFICSTIGYYVLVLVILIYMLSGAYRKNYVLGGDSFTVSYAEKVFSFWDYGIMSKERAELQKKRISTEIKELLSKTGDSDGRREWSEWLMIWLKRIIINIIIFGVIVASAFLIWYLTTKYHRESVDRSLIEQLAMPLCISALNYVMPWSFSIITRYECYESPKTRLYLTMGRTVLLNFATLSVLVYSWFVGQKAECWETFMGSQLYSLIIIDFLFILVTTFLAEFVFRIILGLFSKFCRKKNTGTATETEGKHFQKLEFDVGRNSLNVVYSQMLIWLGIYYSPLISFIMIPKLVVIFYTKKLSVMCNCHPPLKAWRAREASTVLLFIVFVSFLLCVVTFICSILLIKPSKSCGPFRDYNHTYDVFSELTDALDESSDFLNFIVDFFTSAAFLAFVTVVLLVAAYFSHLVACGHYEIAQLLKKQLALEEDDKKFLMDLLRKTKQKLQKSGDSLPTQSPSSNGIDLDMTSEPRHTQTAVFHETINPIYSASPQGTSEFPKRHSPRYSPIILTP